MRRLLALSVLAVTAGLGVLGAAPAGAASDLPVRAGTDNCGNFQVWVNGQPTIHYLVCNPPA